MLPSVILFAFYIWEPLLENVRLSLYSTIRYQTVDFVGLANYARVLKVPDFKAAFVNTFFLYVLVAGDRLFYTYHHGGTDLRDRTFKKFLPCRRLFPEYRSGACHDLDLELFLYSPVPPACSISCWEKSELLPSCG